MPKNVTLGDNANIFHDGFTGVTIAKGETKILTDRQLRNKRIKSALSAGHLQIAPEKEINEVIIEDDDEVLTKLEDKFKAMYKSGKDVKKVADAFKFDELKALATEFEVELEEDDTKVTVVEALFETLKSE